MSSPIQSVVNLAKATLKRSLRESKRNFKDLLHQVESIKAEDVGIVPETYIPFPENYAGGYVGIYGNRDVAVEIFIVNQNQKIPLHNHPGMYGIIKCLVGRLKIVSYTLIRENDDGTVWAQKHEDAFLEPDSKPAFLSPDSRNIHEVSNASSTTPAAFLDILSPPYNIPDQRTFRPNDNIRDCIFFRTLRTGKSGETLLSPINAPEDYVCFSDSYRGPPIHD